MNEQERAESAEGIDRAEVLRRVDELLAMAPRPRHEGPAPRNIRAEQIRELEEAGEGSSPLCVLLQMREEERY